MISLAEHLETEPMGAIVAERQELARLADAKKVQALTRRYAAAKVSGLNTGWTTQPTVANYEIRQAIRVLRARARQGARDNGHFKKYLRKQEVNVIGRKSLQLQCQAYLQNKKKGKRILNAELNSAVEMAFWKWGTNPAFASVSGKMNWNRILKLAIRNLKKDGEVLCQMVKADNPFGFSLRSINVDYLDELYNDIRPDGNRVIMSVEIDANWKPVAYWLTTPTTNIMFAEQKERRRVRVPAEEIIHAFYVTDDEEQVRGVTSFHAALLNAKHTAGYLESVIVAGRAGASQIAVIEEDIPLNMDENDVRLACYEGKTEEEIAAMREPKIDLTPGTISRLPAGMKMNSWNPNQPNQNHPEFLKSLNMEEGAALDMPYFSLLGDMESVNFSSARVGREDEREVYLDDQDFIADFFCTPIFHAWLRSAWLYGAITLQSRDMEELQFPKWRGRGWPFIQPDKDVAANLDAIRGGIKTPREVIEETGKDYDEFLSEYEDSVDKGKAAGIDYKAAAPKAVAPDKADAETGDEPDPKPSDKKKGKKNGE